MNAVTRLALGLTAQITDDWRTRAACTRVRDPDIFFETVTRPVALHICRRHCDVAAQCCREALNNPPYDCVMGGIAWRAMGHNTSRPAILRSNTYEARGCELCGGDRRPIPHGTRSGYQYWRCRCDRCREASRVDTAARKAGAV